MNALLIILIVALIIFVVKAFHTLEKIDTTIEDVNSKMGKLKVDLLGTSFTIQANEETEYLEKLLKLQPDSVHARALKKLLLQKYIV